MTRERKPVTSRRLALAMMAILIGGCAAAASPAGDPQARNNQPPPAVEDCHILSQGSPQRFVCSDGKEYTAHQLEIAREKRQRPNGPGY